MPENGKQSGGARLGDGEVLRARFLSALISPKFVKLVLLNRR
jgi:hypothetical protein